MPQTARPRRTIGGALFLIALGVVVLVFQLRPGFDPWPLVEHYWPLILIFLGFGKLFDYMRSRQHPDEAQPPRISGAAVAMLALLALFVAAAARGKYTGSPSWGMQDTASTVDLQGAKSVRAAMVIGAGQVHLSGGTPHLLEAEFRFNGNQGVPQVDYSVSGGVGDLQIRQESESHIHWGSDHNDWRLKLGKDVPVELIVHMGAGQGDLNLRDVPLTRLEVNMGAGQLDLDLTGPRKENMTVVIHGGVGQARIRLPKDVGVRADAHGGIGSIDVSGLRHDGGEYVNDAYGKSPVTIDLNVQGGVGQITLEVER